MIIVMQPNASEAAVQQVVAHIRQQGLHEHISRGTEHTIIGAVGDERVFDVATIEALPEVERAIRIMQDWRIISREAWARDTQITIRGVRLGGDAQTVLLHAAQLDEGVRQHCLLDPFFEYANPYIQHSSLNQKEMMKKLSAFSQQIHANHQLLAMRIRDSVHIQIALNADVDILYVGGELLNNINLLNEIGDLNTPAIVCKDTHHTVRDWLLAAERIVLRGNQHVLLGEAGTLALHGAPLRLDVDAVVQAKKLSHLPLVANISHLAHRYMDQEMLLALARTAGADAIVV